MWHREEKFKEEKGRSDFKKGAFQKHPCLNEGRFVGDSQRFWGAHTFLNPGEACFHCNAIIDFLKGKGAELTIFRELLQARKTNL